MKPYVLLNAAMSLDGKIASKTGDSELSCEEDWIRVHELRKSVHAVMVGINTVMKDDPKLTVRKIPCDKKDYPIRVVVDSKARTPENARVLSQDAPTIIAVSEKAPKERIKALEKKAKVIICGKNKVDLKKLLEELYNLGIRKLLLEGGGTLNWSMLKNKLVDEIRVAISPVIVGGENAITLVEGEGFELVKEGIKLKLIRYYTLGKNIVLEYRVI